MAEFGEVEEDEETWEEPPCAIAPALGFLKGEKPITSASPES